jgi:hypothetical protein
MLVRILLWVSGALALFVLANPRSVQYGYIFLIIPGLVMELAPTVFVYTATFVIVRRYVPTFLPITHARAVKVVAAGITLGLGVLVVLPMAGASWVAFHWAARGDVVPHDPVVLKGDILLDNDETRAKAQVSCDALCAALLDTPGVGTVTIAHENAPTSYRLVPKGEANGAPNAAPKRGSSSRAISLESPEKILLYLPDKPGSGEGRDFQAQMAARRAQEGAIIAHWGLRLANDVTLSIVPAPRHHDLTISMTSTHNGFQELAVRNVEVRDGQGHVLLRRQRVTAERVVVPLRFELYRPFDIARWRLARTDLATDDRLNGVNSITVLFNETTLARPAGPAAAPATSMRDRLAAAVMQPGAPADLSLADAWVATLDWWHVSDGDIALLGKLIADPRVIDLPHLYHDAASNVVSAELRGAIVARLLNPATSPQLRDRLDWLVRFMPPGTFAVSTPNEVALLHNQLLRLKAPALVRRLADQGKAGVPELVRILQEDVQVEPWLVRRHVLAAVRRALVRLGSDAASALPVVVELFDQPNTPLANYSDEMSAWRIAMIRMGRPVEDVPFPPRTTDEERSDLMRFVERLDTTDDSRF